MCVKIFNLKLFHREAIAYLRGPFFVLGNELFGNLTVFSRIRDLRRVQDMNCYSASPATVDTVFYSDSHAMAEHGEHFLENDGLVEFRGVGLPCFTRRPLEALQSVIVLFDKRTAMYPH